MKPVSNLFLNSWCALPLLRNIPLTTKSFINFSRLGVSDTRINRNRISIGYFYQLSPINLVWGPLKCAKSNFNPVHVFLHFKSFGLVVLQLILASKLSELEQFEKQARNCLFANKIEFSGKWLHPRAKLKKTDPT